MEDEPSTTSSHMHRSLMEVLRHSNLASRFPVVSPALDPTPQPFGVHLPTTRKVEVSNPLQPGLTIPCGESCPASLRPSSYYKKGRSKHRTSLRHASASD